ncbi:sensor histidine kinase [Gulosibacter molinativorax]|uniref:histidine kinase n=1 Tax=Gulosibacter molinativorax TaxID=256821 RepID=A0ABT7C9E3_9MICO|nr:histidine kinase [Gulosibacter molinativorax]MDJ1371823.1 two-component sensor histidine kinase [Gulosibacter molinativorax]QUY60805.1 Hypotetical protein [Gulosibacter molinativorax]
MNARRIAAAALLVAMVVGGYFLGAAESGSALNGVFVAVVATLVWVLGVIIARALKRSRDARRAAREILALDDHAMIERSVADERRRLAEETDRQLRATLAEIAATSAEHQRDSASDLGAVARSVHRASREATAELRRQLGLLRSAEQSPASGSTEARHRGWAPRYADAIVTVIVVVMALAEGAPYFGSAFYAGAWSAASTALASSTTLMWRKAPEAGAIASGVVWLGAALLGAPVVGGLWVFANFGLLAYGVAARARIWVALGTLVAFALAIGIATWLVEPLNVPINLLTIAVGAMVGFVVRWSRVRVESARRSERKRSEALRPQIEQAISTERGGFARELHDTVSHAVGVIAMQAGAAEVSLPEHPERSRAALAVAHETAVESLAELNRPRGGASASVEASSAAEAGAGLSESERLHALIDRFRKAGLEVTYRGDAVPEKLQPLVLRVILEGLTNVLRHAETASATVSISREPENLRISVANGGRPRDAPHPHGFGLVGLRERVELAGGAFTAGPGTVEGFQLEAIVPLERSAA